jgi:hypothetical protein
MRSLSNQNEKDVEEKEGRNQGFVVVKHHPHHENKHPNFQINPLHGHPIACSSRSTESLNPGGCRSLYRLMLRSLVQCTQL